MNDNQEAAKQKMERILFQASASTPSTPAEDKTIGVKEEKVMIKKNLVKKECKALDHETVESEGVQKAFYDGIHSTIERNKDWKRKTGETLSLQQ